MKRWYVCHVMLTRARYLERLSEGALFYTTSGEHLPTIDAVREAMKRDGEVISRC